MTFNLPTAMKETMQSAASAAFPVFRTGRYAALAALALGLAASCAKETDTASAKETDGGRPADAVAELRFTVKAAENAAVTTAAEPEGGNAAPAVKSYLDNNLDGTYTPKWRKGDRIAAFTGAIAEGTEADGSLANESDDGETASFSGTFTAASEGEFKAVSPEGRVLEGCAPEDGAEIVCVNLGDPDDGYAQSPTWATIDGDCDILVSKPAGYLADDGVVVLDDVYFKRVMSVVKVNVKGPESYGGEKIRNFTVASSDAVLAGCAKIDVTNAKVAGWSVASNSVKAVYSSEDDMPVLYDAENLLNSVYLVVNPTTVAAGATLTFSGETEYRTFSREVTLGDDVILPEGQMAVINLTLDETNFSSKYALNYNGWENQEVKIKNTNFAFSPDGKTAYTVTYNTARILAAFDLESGSLKWTYNLDCAATNNGHIAVNPVTGDVVASSGTKLFCIKDDGSVRWSADGFGDLSYGAGAAFSPDASTIYAGNTSKELWAVNASDGTKLGSVELGGTLTAVVVDGTTLFAATSSTKGYFFDVSDPASITETGTVSYTGAGTNSSSASVATDGKTLYFASKGYLHCVDLSAKTLVKSEKLTTDIVCGTVVTSSGDVAVAYKTAAGGGAVALYSAGLETKKWDVTPATNKNLLNFNCPVVDENGDFYIVDAKANAWFIKAEDGSCTKLHTGPQDLQNATGMCGNILLNAGNAAPASVFGWRVPTSRGSGWSGTGGDPCCTKCVQWVYGN